MKTSAFTSIAYTHQAALWSARYHVNSCVSEPALWIHPWLLAGRLDDLDGEEGIMGLGWLAWLNIEIVTELEGPIICWGKREKIGGLSKTIFRWDVSVKKIHFWRNIKFTKISLQEILSDVWNNCTSWNCSQKIQFLDCCMCSFSSLFFIVSVSWLLWPSCYFLCCHTGFIPLCLAVGFPGTCF